MSWPPGERRCTAHKKDGTRCNNAALRGQTVCGSHGGKAPQALAAGRDRALEQQADRYLRGITRFAPIDNPFLELLELAGRAKVWMERLSGIVGEMREDHIRYIADGVGTEQLDSRILLYERSIDRLGGLLTNIARLGIEDRLARIEEMKADAIVQALDAAVAEAGIDTQPAVVLRGAFARHLRAVDT